MNKEFLIFLLLLGVLFGVSCLGLQYGMDNKAIFIHPQLEVLK
jgi:hypothetical protein